MPFLCPHCGYDDFEIVDDEREFRIHACHACGKTYGYNRTAEEIADIDAEETVRNCGIEIGQIRMPSEKLLKLWHGLHNVPHEIIEIKHWRAGEIRIQIVGLDGDDGKSWHDIETVANMPLVEVKP